MPACASPSPRSYYAPARSSTRFHAPPRSEISRQSAAASTPSPKPATICRRARCSPPSSGPAISAAPPSPRSCSITAPHSPPKDNDGQTGLHLATLAGHIDTVKLLLSRGAPLEVENNWGGAVLSHALWAALNA